MMEWPRAWLVLRADRRAVTAMEYGLIAGALAVMVVVAFDTFGIGLIDAFTRISAEL